MPRHLWILLFATIVQPFASAAGPGAGISKYSCEYDLKQRYGTFGMTSIEVRNEEIQAIDHMNRDVAGSGRYAFGCWLDKKRNEQRTDEQQVWRDTGNTTTVNTKYSPEYFKEGDSLTVIRTKSGYLVDMSKLGGHPFCGVGAALPKSVFISKTTKRCEVRLR